MIGVVAKAELGDQTPADVLGVEAGAHKTTPVVAQIERVVVLVDAGAPSSHAERLYRRCPTPKYDEGGRCHFTKRRCSRRAATGHAQLARSVSPTLAAERA